MERNIDQIAGLVSRDRLVQQMHWGGGTPNYLAVEQIQRLWDKLHNAFSFAPDAEISIEVNPSYLNRDYVLSLRKLGFNRISFGFKISIQSTGSRQSYPTISFII